MHTAESIRSLTGQGFLKLIDQCDPEELTFLLSAMWGDAPDTLAGALNIVEQRRAEPEPLPAQCGANGGDDTVPFFCTLAAHGPEQRHERHDEYGGLTWWHDEPTAAPAQCGANGGCDDVPILCTLAPHGPAQLHERHDEYGGITAWSDEPEPERVPHPTGLCGHPVTPGARAMGFVKCRDCLAGNPSAVATYDRATADEQMAAAVSA